MTASAVRTRCSGIMSSIEETYKLAIGVCAFCPVYVKLVRSFDQLVTNPFYTEPLQVVYAEYDTCHGGCADNCTRHQRKCLAGYCHNCDHPLVVVAQRLQMSYGSFDNGKPFDSKALLEKRLCRHSQYCPGSDKSKHDQGCIPASSHAYAEAGKPTMRHPSDKMYMHEMLIDIMVMNFRNQLVVGEYMKALAPFQVTWDK